jgi:hypothetical protein
MGLPVLVAAAVVALILPTLLPTGEAARVAGTNQTVGPPYVMTYVSGSMQPSATCHGSYHVGTPLSFNNSTGALRLQMSVHAPNSSPCRTLSTSAYVLAQVYLTGASFRTSVGGVRVVRSDWRFAGSYSFQSTRTNSSDYTHATLSSYLSFGVCDATIQYCWPEMSDSNITEFAAVNSTGHTHFDVRFSLPFLLAMTKGDLYYWQAQLTIQLDAVAEFPGESASGSLALGVGGAQAGLTSIVVR